MYDSGCILEMIQSTLFGNFDQILSKSSLQFAKDTNELVTEYNHLDLDNNEKILKHSNDKKYLHAMLFHFPNIHIVL